jgi:PAS domain S-box-containing protein
LRGSLIENNETLAEKILGGIERELDAKLMIVQGYSSDLILQKELIKSNRAFQGIDDKASFINERDRAWTSAPWEEVTPLMQSLMSNELAEELKDKIGFLESREGFRVFGEIFVTNEYGTNIAMSGKSSDYNQADEEWWKMTRENGTYISEVNFDESSGVYSIDLGVRVDDKNKNFMGTIKAVLNIENIFSFIKSLELTSVHKEHKYMPIKILDRFGRMIYSTEEFEFLHDSSHLIPPGHLNTDNNHHLHYSEERQDEKRGSIIISHAHSAGFGDINLDWSAIIEHDKDEIFASVYVLRNQLIMISVLLTGVGLFIGFIVATPISRNIRKLMTATERIGRGDMDHDLDVSTKDEIGKLADSLKSMTDELKSSTVQRADLLKEIEERKKAEELLFRAKQEWEETFNTITDMITVHDKDFNIIGANTAAKKLLKLPELELNKVIKCFSFYHGTDCPPQGCPSCDCLNTGIPAAFELYEPFLKMFVEIRAIPRLDNNKELIGLIHIVRDITEQKRIEKIVKRGKIEWEMTVDNANEYIVLVDRDAKILRSNKSFASFVGSSVQELVGQNIREFLPVHKEQLKADMPATKIEVMTVNKEWLYLSYCPILDEKGNFQRAVIIGTDVTNLKYTEEKLISSEKELKKRVDELEKFYEMAVGREVRMSDLKKEILSLKKELSMNRKASED